MIGYFRKNRKLREQNEMLEWELEIAQAALRTDAVELKQSRHAAANSANASDRYAKALHAIVDQETPGANATVKRMAKMARRALGENE